MNDTNEKHSVRVDLMMMPSELRAIDGWRRQQPDLPTRAEAIRRLIHLGLTAKTLKTAR